MKYIVMALADKEEIFVFSRTVDHDRMFEACEAIRFGDSRNWNRKYRDGECVAAGFIDNGQCHGRSETLAIESRGEKDTELLAGFNAAHGIQPAAITDAEINDITMNKIGKWPSFEAQSWACKVVHAVLAALPPVQSESKDAERYRFVKTMSKEMLLFWRGAYSFDDAAIDAVIAASQFTAKEADNGK